MQVDNELSHDGLTPKPLAAAVFDPRLNLPKQDIRLKILRSEDPTLCNFWVGLAKEGTRSPGDLLTLDAVQDIFTGAATLGLAQSLPLLLSDTAGGQARYIYLLPTPEEGEAMGWSKELARTIHSLSPKAVGIYLCSELLEINACYPLLQEMLRELVLGTNCFEFYLLLGEHGLNPILNAALDLRAQLFNQKINLAIFH